MYGSDLRKQHWKFSVVYLLRFYHSRPPCEQEPPGGSYTYNRRLRRQNRHAALLAKSHESNHSGVYRLDDGTFRFPIQDMALEITHREREGIQIVHLEGRLTMGEEDLRFRNEIDKLVRTKNRLVLNLTGLAEVDTTGLGTLVYALAKLRKQGGGMALVNLKSSHIELFELAKLETVFEVFGDEQEAINSFFPGREVRRYDILQFIQNLRKKKPL